MITNSCGLPLFNHLDLQEKTRLCRIRGCFASKVSKNLYLALLSSPFFNPSSFQISTYKLRLWMYQDKFTIFYLKGRNFLRKKFLRKKFLRFITSKMLFSAEEIFAVESFLINFAELFFAIQENEPIFAELTFTIEWF